MKFTRILALLLAAVLLLGVVPPLGVRAFADGETDLPYWIGVDLRNQRVTIYRTSDNGVLHRWLCSTGASATPTPLGTYKIPTSRNTNRHEWYYFGGVYVKYATRIVNGIYFHSILFARKSDSTLKVDSLKKLGSPASHGCIRLEVTNAKWISENIPIGTTVIIHKGVDDPRITKVLGGNAGLAVTPSIPAPPSVTALKLDQTGTVTLKKGETLQLNCTIEPAAATTTLTWKSSKSRIVGVNKSGLVTAKGNGTATITVSAANGVRTRVKVESVDPTVAKSVSLDKTGTVYLNKGETLQLNATVLPDTAVAGLTWKSSRTRYAIVNATGLVTGVERGTTRVTVTTANRKRATVVVKVLDPSIPDSVRFAETGPITLHVGETVKLNPLLEPTTATTSYKYTSSKKRVATVTADGTVTAKRKGKAKITVRTANKKKATIIVRVVP